MNPIIDLSVTARLAARTLARRLRGELEPPPDPCAFEEQMETALAALPVGTVRAHRWVTIPATEPPWRDTGVVVRPGREVGLFAVGRVYASRLLDVWVRPRNQIWARVGEKGEIRSSSRDSQTLTSDEAGPLFLGNYFPNEWQDRTGSRLQDDRVYASVSGETRVLIVEWERPAREGLAALLAHGDPLGLVSGEIDRLDHGTRSPAGWHHLWHLGETEIFRADEADEGTPTIQCDVEGDVGILQKDVDFPFTPDTELAWSWTVDALPGLLREDTIPSHDYLSIAVEFDTGWDITYYWSTVLPEGTGYVCPLPNWKHREYHVVVRRGHRGLGTRHDERRNLHRDYERYLRDRSPPPTRVVAVWLIANSVFQRRTGRCAFSGIRLHEGERQRVVL